jgi:arylsulfatase
MPLRVATVIGSTLVCLVMLTQVAGQAPAPPARPNVLVILLDDVGYGDFSCHGNPVIATPNIDRLHATSVRLVDFHVAPMCTPTRGQLLTGVDALRNGASVVATSRMLPRRELPTAADLFARAGYRTGQFGKWHLGDSFPFRPMERGFQDALYHHLAAVGQASDWWRNDYFDPFLRRNGVPEQRRGYITDLLFDEAMSWMRQRRERGEPFFCYLPLNSAHGPHFVPRAYRDRFAQMKPGQASFFGMVANIDANIARLEAFLKDERLDRDTIVVFLTDNGGTVGVPVWNAGMRGRKTQSYEGGHRVPCFVRWPAGGLGSPRDVAGLTQAQDLLPTLAELCGIEDLAGASFDGVSLARVLRGEAEVPDRTLVVQYGLPRKGKAAVMWRRWRLIDDAELYDLEQDPGQERNVIAAQPEVAARLRAEYERWWAGVEPWTRKRSALVVGDERANPTTLAAPEWQEVYLAASEAVRAGDPRGDAWKVEVSRAGRYELALRRWPEESGLALGDPAPAFEPRDTASGEGKLPAGVALPIARAWVEVAEHHEEQAVAPTEPAAVITLDLPAGTTTLRGGFQDAAGRPLCGAYYVTVRRLP